MWQLHSLVGRSPQAFLSRPGTWDCHKGMVHLRSVPNPQLSQPASAPICRTCIGAATTATLAGIEDSTIQTLGHWHSAATRISVVSHGPSCSTPAHGILLVAVFCSFSEQLRQPLNYAPINFLHVNLTVNIYI